MTDNQEKIIVVGVGGCGNNVVNQLIDSGFQGVDYLALDTDESALLRSKTQTRIQLGNDGLGSGGRRGFAKGATRKCKDILTAHLKDAGMVFVVAGMGGGTGNGAAGVVASYAKDTGATTIVLAVKPFTFEGTKRITRSLLGEEDLFLSDADMVIRFSADHVLKQLAKNAVGAEAFRILNDKLCRTVKD